MSNAQATILHIDDNEANRYLVHRILQDADFDVIEAATGACGLEAIAEQAPALIILDVKLPDASGFDVCRQIRSTPESAFIPVLHLSATFTDSENIAAGLESGADAYLTYPVEPIELVATVRSLLRIRQAESAASASARQWQTTFDAIKDSVCLVNQESTVIRCNRAMTKLLREPASSLLGCNYDELVRTKLKTGDGSCFRRAKETRTRQVLEFQVNERWFAKTVDPILDEENTFNGAVLTLADITERKQSEALLQAQNERLNQLALSLRQQTEQAQQANRIKDEFLAVLSHELRSPLNPILGWAKLLQVRKLDEAKTKHALATIERNARLQSQLIEDLLDVSRILRGKLNLKIDQVDLPIVIAAALETVRTSAEAKSIQIQQVFAPNIVSVTGDASRLQQVVWNLLSNAVKFTPVAGQVQVRLEQVDSPDNDTMGYAQISVKDTGKGIDPDFLPHVFDYFRQADGSTTRQFGGLGLGLAIVHYLVELHGGTVQAESPGEGQGATFTVRLPTVAASSIDSNKSSSTTHSETDLNALRVLVVDDEQDSREFVAFLLQQYGAVVTIAQSTNQALSFLEQADFDLLISDIGMPTSDGYALIRQIRSRTDAPGKIAAIALTAYASEADQQQAIAAGFQKHITKPIEPEEFVRVVWTVSQGGGRG